MGQDDSNTLIPFSWFEDPIKKSIRSVFEDLNTATEALDIFHKYRRNHFERLASSLRDLKILGMSRPVALMDVYSPALVSTTIHGRLYEQEWHLAEDTSVVRPTLRQRDVPLVHGDEYVEQQQRVVVLGAPGSGKTTFLKHLALAYCDKRVFSTSKLKSSKFPFFISLLSYAGGNGEMPSLDDYLSRELQTYTDQHAPYFVKRILSKGLAVLILDSLDEVPPSSRRDVIDAVKSFCKAFPRCKVLISCRTADYREVFENFYEVELARLTDAAVKKILEAWFADEPSKLHELLRHLKRDKDLRSLCETPLLLSLLCIQFRHDLALPKRKTELYRRCIDAFLREWDASRGFRRDTAYSSLSDDRKERLFESVAGRCFTGDVRYVIQETELAAHIAECCELYGLSKSDAPGVLSEIERHHGILERFSASSFMFSHPSFQEYFAARDILAKRNETEILKKHFQDHRWSTVIEFIVAMHPDPLGILQFLADKSNLSSIQYFPPMARKTHTLWLLYRCLCAGAAIPKHTRNSLCNHIVESHLHMSRAFMAGGVFPIAALLRDGVRHAYVYYQKPRETLHQALQPLRLLANEILLSPMDEYAQQAVVRFDQLALEGPINSRLSNAATLLCLAIPIAFVKPEEVGFALQKVREADLPPYMHQIVEESLDVLRKGLV